MSGNEPDDNYVAPPAYSVTDKNNKNEPCCRLSLHQLKAQDGLFVKVEPPERSPHGLRAPVDITLVIDVSRSMGVEAPMPRDSTGQQLEQAGLTTLDLVKHTANAVIQALDGRDRLAIVTFSTQVETVQPLQPMVDHKKELARNSVNGLQADGCTCLWGGICEGLKHFRENDDVGNVRAVMVLTDGRPYGYGCTPSDGWPSAMRKLGMLPAAVHTFGFGYDLQEGLLQTIAGLGGGSYCFISDIGMIGTAIIHATANLQSTFARKAILSLTVPREIGLEESWIDIDRRPARLLPDGRERYTIDLRTIRYGQPLHRYFRSQCGPDRARAALESRADLAIEATLEYDDGKQIRQVSSRVELGTDADVDADVDAGLSAGDIAYHMSRTQLAAFLSTLFPLDSETGLYAPVHPSTLADARKRLEATLQELPASQDAYRRDGRNIALIKDFRMPDGARVAAEVDQALEPKAWRKWGRHFLPGLLFAYVHEMRMSFRDPGTQVFGGNQFQALVDVLSTAFDTLPPPATSTRTRTSTSAREKAVAQLNRSDNECFAGETRVLLALSRARSATVLIRELRAGTMVQTLKGPKMVQAVVCSRGDVRDGIAMCDLPAVAEGHGRLRVTLWHPISLDEGATWHFPATLAERGHGDVIQMSDREDVYSVLLQRDNADDHPDYHSINVDGVWGVTLGHGLTAPGEAARAADIRNHPFYGNHDAVVASLDTMPKGPTGMTLIPGMSVKRDETTGLVAGFTSCTRAES